ncbi:MAG: Fic family protein [Pseudobdellovibrio sp.]
MKLTPLISFVAASLVSISSFAISNSCSLMQVPVPAELGLSADAIATYQAKLKSECWWTQAYAQLKDQLQVRYGVNIENVSEYQAMRFVRRVDYENSKKNEIPVEKTYQILKSQYDLPNDQKPSTIWDNWIKGISILPNYADRVKKGEDFDFESLKRVHVGFFQLSNEVGDYAHIPDEGVMKPPADEDNYWWSFDTEEDYDHAQVIVNTINAQYQQLGLAPNTDGNDELNDVLDIREAVKLEPPGKENVIEYVQAIYAGNTKMNLTHLKNILNFANTMMKQALQNKHLVWNGQFLMTPLEVALLTQKFYVGVHPFSEGNGRTSRFLQELILTLMNMPHGSSGDLMDFDVLTTFPDYYQTAMTANIKLMQTIKSCFDGYAANPPSSFITTDQKAVPYSCRILKPKS